MVDSQARDGQDPELTLLPVAVRATGRDGVAGGVGFFIASDLVSTCAHAVSDAPGPPCVALADVVARGQPRPSQPRVEGCGMGEDADEATPKPEVVNNQITDDAVVVGPVVQVGTFTGQIHYHYQGDRRPLDLLALRLWVDRIAADYRAMVEDTGDRTGAAHVRQLDLVRAGLADSGPENERSKDVVRRLIVAGICGYLACPGAPPDKPVPEHILLDLIVFSLWPVVTARKLPTGWQGELAQITSPRLAALVERARNKHKPSAEMFARTVADRSFSSAMATLFDDLADPRRGGALLTAMAIAGSLPAPPTGRWQGKKVAAWALVIAGGAALAEALKDRDSRAGRIIGEMVTNLPDPSDPFDPTDLVDLFEWLLG